MTKVAVIFALLAFSAIATSPVVAPAPEGSNDITQCLNDINTLVTLIPQLINDISSGDIAKMMKDLTELINLVQKVISDCTQSEEMMKANGITPECIKDITDTLPLIQKTINDISAGDISAILGDVMQLVSAFQKIAKDCTAATFPEFQRNDMAQCLQDINQLVVLIPQLINDLESGDFSKIIKDLTTLVQLVQKTVSDCVSHQDNLHMHGINPQCITDITNALPIIQKTISDISSGDIAAVLQDVMQLVSAFQAIVKDCTSSSAHFQHIQVKSALRQ